MNQIIEWAQVTPGLVVVATQECAWLHRPNLVDLTDPFGVPMEGEGSFATTRNLLDGAIGAAQRSAPEEPTRPRLTLARWVWRLAGYYHTTHATPCLMAEAAERFAAAGRRKLADYARRKVDDESGHDELALQDLRSLGYRAEDVVEVLVPAPAAILVEHFARCVRALDPVGCVGYAYALERLAITIGPDYLREVERLIPPSVRATRCLRVHSAMSADVSHVQDALEVTAALSAVERSLVAQASYETARIISTPPPDGYVSEEALERILGTLRNQPSKTGRS